MINMFLRFKLQGNTMNCTKVEGHLPDQLTDQENGKR